MTYSCMEVFILFYDAIIPLHIRHEDHHVALRGSPVLFFTVLLAQFSLAKPLTFNF